MLAGGEYFALWSQAAQDSRWPACPSAAALPRPGCRAEETPLPRLPALLDAVVRESAGHRSRPAPTYRRRRNPAPTPRPTASRRTPGKRVRTNRAGPLAGTRPWSTATSSTVSSSSATTGAWPPGACWPVSVPEHADASGRPALAARSSAGWAGGRAGPGREHRLTPGPSRRRHAGGLTVVVSPWPPSCRERGAPTAVGKGGRGLLFPPRPGQQ